MGIFTPPIDLDRWSPDKSDLTRWYYELAKYLRDHPIPGDDTISQLIVDYLDKHPITGDFYSPTNEPPYPVTSVNGKTGAVNIATGDPEVEERLSGLETQTTQLTTAVGAINDVLPQKYSPSNQPPYPVTSVNGEGGDVTVTRIHTPRSYIAADDYISGKLVGFRGFLDGKINCALLISSNGEMYAYGDNLGQAVRVYSDRNPPPDIITIKTVTATFTGEDGGYLIDGTGEDIIGIIYTPYVCTWTPNYGTKTLVQIYSLANVNLTQVDDANITFKVIRYKPVNPASLNLTNDVEVITDDVQSSDKNEQNSKSQGGSLN